MKTFFPSEQELQANRRWHLVDLTGKTLGRQATEIASILRGKHRADYSPFLDTGDFVVVINADKVSLSGGKWDKKMYYRHSGFPGGIKERTASEMREKAPIDMITLAVRGMLPKGPLGRKMLKKLKVYAGSEHPHQAQNLEPVKF